MTCVTVKTERNKTKGGKLSVFSILYIFMFILLSQTKIIQIFCLRKLLKLEYWKTCLHSRSTAVQSHISLENFKGQPCFHKVIVSIYV